MKLFLAAFVLCATAMTAFPSELAQRAAGDLSKTQSITTYESGTNNGYYYTTWTNGGGEVTYTNGDNGEYSVTWVDCGDFTSGKGWNPANAQTVTYSGEFNPSGNAYLAVYGWTTLVEFFLHLIWTYFWPGHHLPANQPEFGNSHLQPVLVREARRNCHHGQLCSMWTGDCVHNSDHNYQIVATEAWYSSGSATIVAS
nr:xylanase 3 [Penicillium occitanis (nom. inval.)]